MLQQWLAQLIMFHNFSSLEWFRYLSCFYSLSILHCALVEQCNLFFLFMVIWSGFLGWLIHLNFKVPEDFVFFILRQLLVYAYTPFVYMVKSIICIIPSVSPFPPSYPYATFSNYMVDCLIAIFSPSAFAFLLCFIYC